MTSTTYNNVHNTASDTLLRRALAFDAAFSGGAALLFIVAHAAIAEFIGLADPAAATVLLFLGIFFVFWAGVHAYAARQPQLDLRLARFIMAVDFVWSLGSFILLISGVLGLNTVGNWALLLQGDAVLLFGIAKFIGIRRLNA